MNNIWTIMSKEFARFFGDKRMVITTLAPALLIYVIYSMMGTMMGSVFAPDADHKPQVYAVNVPASVIQMTRTADINILPIDANDAQTIKNAISEKAESADVLAIFPPEFDALVEGYNALDATAPAPNIEMYYNSTSPNSEQTYHILVAMFDVYESSFANKFDINRGVDSADLASSEDVTASFIATMMPMLMMIFLVSGSMGLALESITGEKERGTLATLLVSPLRRSELAIGKILSLVVLSFISGLATILATIMSLPNLIGMGEMNTLDTSIYGMTEYMLLAFVVLSVLLVIVAMLSIVSAFSKTVKEAGQASTPVMILVMIVGVSGMFGTAPENPIYYAIPLYGAVQSMSGIFSLNYDAMNITVACLSSLVYAGIGSFILTRMFNSEKVMFSR